MSSGVRLDEEGSEGAEPSLESYLERIGISGPTRADEATLRTVHRAHVQSLPFENIDVLLGRGVSLDPTALFRKLVEKRRGGYCFELNGLLLWALGAMGFCVTPLSGRVRLGRPREFVPPRSHLFLRIELDGKSLLVDGGVGGLSPTAPLLLQEGLQLTPHEPRRLVREGSWDGWERRSPAAVAMHQVLLGNDWQDVYEFTLEPMPEVDREVANWYLTTHPASHFRDKLMVARAFDGGRATLLNREFKRRTLDGGETTRHLEGPQALGDVLGEHFGIQNVDVEALYRALPGE